MRTTRREMVLQIMTLVRQMPAGGVYQTAILEAILARVPEEDLLVVCREQGVFAQPEARP